MKKSEALLLKAKQHLQHGEVPVAEILLGKVLKKDKSNLEAWFLLGNVMGGQGLHQQARDAFKCVIDIDPRVPEAHRNIGLSYIQQQQWHDAVEPLKKAVKLAPQYDAAYNALIEALDKSEQLTEAIAYCERWIQLQPNEASRYLRAGVLNQANDDYTSAADCYQRAIDLGLIDYTLYLNYGVVQQFLSRYIDSIALFEKALLVKPDCAICYYNMAASYYAQGALQKGEQLCEKALAIMPDLHRARGMLLLHLNYHNPLDPLHVFQRHVELAKPLVDATQITFPNSADPDRRLRIGYVSDGFHNNPISTFMMPILTQHDRLKFEITCYADLPRPDNISEQLKALVEHWSDITLLDDDGFYQRIKDDQIDILVDLDGYINPHFNRFARQNAPIQVSYLGYPCTSGMDTVQYRISDYLTDPEDESDNHYSEKLLRLGDSFFCYSPPAMLINPNSLPALHGRGFTFGSFNKQQKLNDDVIALWAAILKALPESRLLMQNEAVSSEAGQERMTLLFRQHGVHEAQLQFAPYSDMAGYLRAHHQVDLMLDSFPWNGHTNTCHALWMGVPTLTMKGEHFSGRFGYGIMTNIGQPEFVAQTTSEYLEKAMYFASNPELMAELRGRLRDIFLKSDICQAAVLTNRLEQHYQEVWHSWCASLRGNQL